MKHLLLTTIFLTSSVAVLPTIAHAGPNESGVLIVHVNEEIVFTDSETTYCGLSVLDACSDADTFVERNGTVLTWVYAAFPETSSPRVSGIEFGIEFEPSEMLILGSGPCAGGLEELSSNWPESGEGVSLTWTTPRTDPFLEVYWMATYAYWEGLSFLDLTGFPDRGANFRDDSVPPVVDPVVDFGRLGWMIDEGYLPCPDPVPTRDTSWGSIKSRFD